MSLFCNGMSLNYKECEYLGLEGSNIIKHLQALPKFGQAPSLHFRTFPQQFQGHLHGMKTHAIKGELLVSQNCRSKTIKQLGPALTLDYIYTGNGCMHGC